MVPNKPEIRTLSTLIIKQSKPTLMALIGRNHDGDFNNSSKTFILIAKINNAK